MAFLPDGEGSSITELIFLMLVYGYILSKAAEYISEGSDLLLVVYGAGIIGGLVIPILGAVPDGLIILFSGTGAADKQAQLDSLAVGVGTLAGSTIMLITIPWAATIYVGWSTYDPITGMTKPPIGNILQRSGKFSLWNSAITVTPDTPSGVYVMLITSLCYWSVQIPAFMYGHLSLEQQENKEHIPALIGLVISIVFLFGYCAFQLYSANQETAQKRKQENIRIKMFQEKLSKEFGQHDRVIKEVFDRFDLNGDGQISASELYRGMVILGMENLNRNEVNRFLTMVDKDNNGTLNFEEFSFAVNKWTKAGGKWDDADLNISFESPLKNETQPLLSVDQPEQPPSSDKYGSPFSAEKDKASKELAHEQASMMLERKESEYKELEEGVKKEHEEEMEMLEKSNRKIILEGCLWLVLGVTVVVVFSDPMVGVLNQMASKLNISAFYISFIVTPMASNASEVITAIYFATCGLEEKLSLSVSSLYGAACLNNTFCLAIFLGIMYTSKLPWQFSAEVLATILVQVVIAILGARRTLKGWHGLIAILCYPLSLVFVALYKKYSDE